MMTIEVNRISAISASAKRPLRMPRHHLFAFLGLLALAVMAPTVVYPVFLMKVLCFALFACAFNLLLGYGGLLSFGHAAYFGSGAYISAYAAKAWGVTPEIAILLWTAAASLLGLFIRVLAVSPRRLHF